MYRIELSPGEETAFRSIEELAVAIRRGVVTSKARVWHNASNKWLPIQFHPHYQTAAAMPLTQADLVAGPPVTPLSSLNIPDPTAQAPRVTGFKPLPTSQQPEPSVPAPRVTSFKPASPYHQPEPQKPSPTSGLPLIEPLGGSTSVPAPVRPEPLKPLVAKPEPVRFQPLKPVAAKPEPVKPLPQKRPSEKPVPAMRAAPVAEEPARKKKRTRGRKVSRRGLRVAFIGALLMAGGQLLVSAGVSLKADALKAQRRLIAVLPDEIKSDSPRTVAAVIPTLRNSSVPGGSAALARKPAVSHGNSARRSPAPTLLPPSVAGPIPVIDSAPEIQPAPAVDIPVPVPAPADSLATKIADSAAQKTLKGILRAVSGSPESVKSSTKR
jgi:hypothetical protein